MLLHAHGVKAGEAEMALICRTNAFTGTDVYAVAVGLRQKLAGTGREVRVVTSDWEALRARKEPALATIRWGLLVDHWVMIQEVRGESARVLDPTYESVRIIPRQELEQIWRGWLVTADLAPVTSR